MHVQRGAVDAVPVETSRLKAARRLVGKNVLTAAVLPLANHGGK